MNNAKKLEIDFRYRNLSALSDERERGGGGGEISALEGDR